MSSSEETPHSNDHRTEGGKRVKKPRTRACDMCRRRKVKCDGAGKLDKACSNCVAFQYTCTYVQPASKRELDAGYIVSLETEVAELRKMVHKYRQVCPNVVFHNDSGSTPPTEAPSPFVPAASGSETNTPVIRPHQLPQASTTPLNRALSLSPTLVESEDLDPSDDETSTQQSFIKCFEDMTFYPKYDHFLGKSSGLMLIRTAIDMRESYEGSEREGATGQKVQLLGERRPVFWSEHPWVQRRIKRRTQQLVFPDSDLIDALVSVYFTESNLYLPLLHRPTFEQSVREGLHLRDANFGCVLLLVCALGAQYSDDPRVLLDDPPQDLSQEERKWIWHSAGWKWFLQVQEHKNFLELSQPKLADLQIVCLSIVFTQSSPHSAWVYIGVGIRFAQELGAHRRKVYNNRSSLESELLKRAFWILLFLDRSASVALGRPCGIQDEDIDLDLPIACDDEYWLNPDPNLVFKQPEGKPSTVSYFNCALRLAQINAFALRTIYSINKSKALQGFVGPKWEQHIVAELDSTMNKWIDSVPDHLRWNPHMENLVFLRQSALLYGSYYSLQITIHRPFIPSPSKPSGISFPSLAICTNAARSCIHVFDVCSKRAGPPSLLSQMALFSAGIVLLVNIWGAKRSGSIADPVKEMKEVHKVMNMFKTLEHRCYTSGRLWDLLYSLVNSGDLPLPERHVRMSQKRTRSSEDMAETTPPLDETPPPDGTRRIAGTRRVQQYQQHIYANSDSGSSSILGDFSRPLPIHSDELGRLPLYPFFNPGSNETPDVASPLYTHAVQDQGAPPWSPNSFGVMPAPSAQPAFSHTPGESLDAASFEAIFSMLPPASYQMAQIPTAPPSQNAGPAYPPNLTSVVSESLEHMMAQTGVPGPQGNAVQNSFEDGALAMWSNAPAGFDWDDWSTYANGFGPTGL